MPTIRDWTYVAIVTLLLATYAVSLVSQAIGARAAPAPSVCMLSGTPPT